MNINEVCTRILTTLTRRPAWAASALVVPLLFAPALSHARDGVLNFRGSVVNYSCDVSASVQSSHVYASADLENVSGIVIHINDARGPCADSAVPFTAHYQSLPTAVFADTAVSSPDGYRAGIVTLTYL